MYNVFMWGAKPVWSTPQQSRKKSSGEKSSPKNPGFLKEILDPSALSAEKLLDLLKVFLLGEVLEDATKIKKQTLENPIFLKKIQGLAELTNFLIIPLECML